MRICSEKYLAQEIKTLFAENWRSITILEKVTKECRNNITSVKEKENVDTVKNGKIVKLPWVPKLGPKLRKELKNIGIKIIFTLGHNLNNSIYRNKSKLLANGFSGVYQLDWNYNALYIFENKKKIITRTIEHQEDSVSRKWESSCATKDCLECHGTFNFFYLGFLS